MKLFFDADTPAAPLVLLLSTVYTEELVYVVVDSSVDDPDVCVSTDVIRLSEVVSTVSLTSLDKDVV